MRIDQLLVAATPGDAITGMALRLRDAHASVLDGDVFALHVAPELKGVVRPFYELTELRDQGPLVYHLSIGCEEIVSWLTTTPRPIVVDYHNITPPRFFEPIDPAFAALLAQGRGEMRTLSRRVTLALADSAYNADELEFAGYRDVRVAAPIVPTQHLRSLEPYGPTKVHLDTVVSGPVLLFVGQLLPHKRIDLLLEAYHVLVSYHRPNVHLVMVGAARNEGYLRAINRQIRELNLPYAWATGPVSDEELVAFLERADVFVTMSEHEGFCFPVVEAFAFGLPVLARRVAALPDTVGNAGLLLAPDAPVAQIAEAMFELLTNESLRSTLSERGRRRVEHFAPERCVARHLELIGEVI